MVGKESPSVGFGWRTGGKRARSALLAFPDYHSGTFSLCVTYVEITFDVRGIHVEMKYGDEVLNKRNIVRPGILRE